MTGGLHRIDSPVNNDNTNEHAKSTKESPEELKSTQSTACHWGNLGEGDVILREGHTVLLSSTKRLALKTYVQYC